MLRWRAALGSMAGRGCFARGCAIATPIAVRLIVADSAGEAEQILKQLQAGADFAVLARENPRTLPPPMAVSSARSIPRR